MTTEAPKPTGYCLSCGAPLKGGLCWCGPKCASEWAHQGAAYVTVDGDKLRVDETDECGLLSRTWFARYT